MIGEARSGASPCDIDKVVYKIDGHEGIKDALGKWHVRRDGRLHKIPC